MSPGTKSTLESLPLQDIAEFLFDYLDELDFRKIDRNTQARLLELIFDNAPYKPSSAVQAWINTSDEALVHLIFWLSENNEHIDTEDAKNLIPKETFEEMASEYLDVENFDFWSEYLDVEDFDFWFRLFRAHGTKIAGEAIAKYKHLYVVGY